MLFLVDEDIVVAVGAFLAGQHDVHYVLNDLGPRTPDADVVAYARSLDAVLVTADRRLAKSIRLKKLVPCLYLQDLRDRELPRVTELIAVVEAEFTQLGSHFWMQIGRDIYSVQR